MNTAIQHSKNTLNTIHSTSNEARSQQESLFKLWINLEKSLQTVTDSVPSSSNDTSDIERQLDEIIDAQDQVANTACQSRAQTFEDLLYTLAIWRSDTPDFDRIPIHADRKDLIIYSVFRDLIKITGLDNIKTNVDNRTNFLGI